jgi:D-alanyl-lipoteichoic acid acyltransferase DltB (MBOAT superfamily)
VDTASLQFVGYGLLAALISNFNRSVVWRGAVLLMASLIFIGLILGGNPWQMLWPFVGFLALGFVAIKLVERGWRRSLVIGIVVIVASYLWLKKYTFIPSSWMLPGAYFTLGLSYIFFRILSLLVTQAAQESRSSIGPIKYLIYLLNFTTLLSGPIQSYEAFAEDQFAPHPLSLDAAIIGLQLERIIRGFFKVTVLAMILFAFQQDALRDVFSPTAPATVQLKVFTLIVIYPFFIYANFSGYIDIVIGLARLMRVVLPENFNRPFSSASYIEFWTRWHITLSQWLKAHVYNPLLIALMRRASSLSLEPMIGVLCFFVTFFLVGLWHGRTSEFLVFGLLQGGGMAANKLWQIEMAKVMGRKAYRQLTAKPLYVIAARGLTFSFFALTLFWFWADWLQIEAVEHAISAPQWLIMWLVVWAVSSFVLATWEWLRSALLTMRFEGAPLFTGRYARVVYGTVLGFAALLVTVVLNQPAPDVVYKAF